jgi:hypothetical protein
MQDIAVLLRKGADCGQFTVTVDGAAGVAFDAYRGYPASISDTTVDGSVYPLDKVWVARGLSDAEHTVMITVSGSHDAGSTDSWVYIDGLEYTRWTHGGRLLECAAALSQLEYGSYSQNLAGSYYGSTTIDFGQTFRSGNTPAVVAVAQDIDHYATVDGITATQATIHVAHRNGANETTTIGVSWIAVG